MVKFPTMKSVVNFKLVSLPGPHSPLEHHVWRNESIRWRYHLRFLFRHNWESSLVPRSRNNLRLTFWLIQNATGISRIHLYQNYWAIAGSIHRKLLSIFLRSNYCIIWNRVAVNCHDFFVNHIGPHWPF